jgi:hypothetical protein
LSDTPLLHCSYYNNTEVISIVAEIIARLPTTHTSSVSREQLKRKEALKQRIRAAALRAKQKHSVKGQVR